MSLQSTLHCRFRETHKPAIQREGYSSSWQKIAFKSLNGDLIRLPFEVITARISGILMESPSVILG